MGRKTKLKEKVKKDKDLKDLPDDIQDHIARFTHDEITLRLDIEVVPTAKLKDLIP